MVYRLLQPSERSADLCSLVRHEVMLRCCAAISDDHVACLAARSDLQTTFSYQRTRSRHEALEARPTGNIVTPQTAIHGWLPDPGITKVQMLV
ncbi:hypothetical protein BAUCODRAFT_34170, partial [Baudoinia panamericana UAMH 10762]